MSAAAYILAVFFAHGPETMYVGVLSYRVAFGDGLLGRTRPLKLGLACMLV